MAKSGSATASDEKKKHARKIVRALNKAYPDADCALHHKTPFHLLVATVLSAQCTDVRVNMVTPKLFEKYPTPVDLALSKQQHIEGIIKSTGFFRAKAKNLRALSKALVDKFQGEVPQNLDDLVALPGIGRKTANVVLGTAFGISSGVVVDTHVKRITRLLGLTDNSNPERVERDLIEVVPKRQWIGFSHRLIHHGRKICIARRPRCPECPLLNCCSRVGLPPL